MPKLISRGRICPLGLTLPSSDVALASSESALAITVITILQVNESDDPGGEDSPVVLVIVVYVTLHIKLNGHHDMPDTRNKLQ